jgi:hypothetical protein
MFVSALVLEVAGLWVGLVLNFIVDLCYSFGWYDRFGESVRLLYVCKSLRHCSSYT